VATPLDYLWTAWRTLQTRVNLTWPSHGNRMRAAAKRAGATKIPGSGR
jgi:hypothetical protein